MDTVLELARLYPSWISITGSAIGAATIAYIAYVIIYNVWYLLWYLLVEVPSALARELASGVQSPTPQVKKSPRKAAAPVTGILWLSQAVDLPRAAISAILSAFAPRQKLKPRKVSARKGIFANVELLMREFADERNKPAYKTSGQLSVERGSEYGDELQKAWTLHLTTDLKGPLHFEIEIEVTETHICFPPTLDSKLKKAYEIGDWSKTTSFLQLLLAGKPLP